MSKKIVIVLLLTVVILLLPFMGSFNIIRTFLKNLVPYKDFWYEYLSYVGTFLTVFIALLVVKWQDLINNRKSLKISWKHLNRIPEGEIILNTMDKLKNCKNFNYILLKLTNTGNKPITITNVHLKLCDKYSPALSTVTWDGKEYQNTDTTFPCKLDVEDLALLHIPLDWVSEMARHIVVEKKYGKATDDIIVMAVDSSEKKYESNVGVNYGYYL